MTELILLLGCACILFGGPALLSLILFRIDNTDDKED